jgi:hypothetical protein
MLDARRGVVATLEIYNRTIRIGKLRHFLARILIQENPHGKLAEGIVCEEEPRRNVVAIDITGEILFPFIGEGAMMQATE